jgi:hypothetical protein
MPFLIRLNTMACLSYPDTQQLILEFQALRAELDDIRTKYAATLAKLDADAGVTDVNYGSLGALAAARFTEK